VLSPTRELATQTEKLVLAIGDYMNIQAHACIGGHSVGEAPGGVLRRGDGGGCLVAGSRCVDTHAIWRGVTAGTSPWARRGGSRVCHSSGHQPLQRCSMPCVTAVRWWVQWTARVYPFPAQWGC
jgi:hypothetical protein